MVFIGFTTTITIDNSVAIVWITVCIIIVVMIFMNIIAINDVIYRNVSVVGATNVSCLTFFGNNFVVINIFAILAL